MKFYLKTFFYPIINYFKNVSGILSLKYKYKNLRLDTNVSVTRSTLGQYNYLSDGVTLVDCVLGDFSYIGKDSFLQQTTVGKFTCIGPNVQVGLGNHPVTGFMSIHPSFYSTAAQCGITFSNEDCFREYEPVVIGHDVWIGAGVIIKGGVSIGDGAVVASGSVVTKNIEPYAIVGGVPARMIKYRFSDDEIRDLQSVKWWNNDFQWFEKNHQLMRDINNIKMFKK